MVYVFFADGFEESEALTPVDIMRRGGVEVKTVGVTGRVITSSHKIPVITDMVIDDIKDYSEIDAVVLPGGIPGTLNLEKNSKVIDIIKYCGKNNVLIGAICAAPSILGHLGLLVGKKATSFPSFQQSLNGAILDEEYVSQDGMIVTARGMGVSTEFGLKLLEILRGATVSKNIKESIQCR